MWTIRLLITRTQVNVTQSQARPNGTFTTVFRLLVDDVPCRIDQYLAVFNLHN
jgi:hypothetical protein